MFIKDSDGTYDDANRLASVIGDSTGYGIVNINMRPYYVEGSKTLAFEVLEQLNWTVPDVLVIPVEKPDTIAKSLAIGDPGDGLYVLKRLRQFNGIGEEVNDDEIKRAILLLAQTEGIFTEPAGGVSVG